MRKIRVWIGLLVCFMLCTLFGCAKKIENINDFSKFSDMTQTTQRIEVEFDNASGVPFYFTIEDQTDIDEIMNIIFSSTFENRGQDGRFAGSNTSISIVQGEKTYNLHPVINKEGKNYYAFATNELQNKINELAREAGAYETAE